MYQWIDQTQGRVTQVFFHPVASFSDLFSAAPLYVPLLHPNLNAFILRSFGDARKGNTF